MKIVTLNELQTKAIRRLWFIYGNDGKKHTHYNHRFIQDILERGEYDINFWVAAEKCAKEDALTDECIDDVDYIISNTL